jgi:methionyl-tRNA synthetase
LGSRFFENTLANKSFYITTTIPYVNADPHIGFALEIVQADIVARHKKLAGCEVFFNTGTDEHGVKIYRKAVGEGKEPQAYVDFYAAKYRALLPTLGISEDVHFVRTTDPAHHKAAEEFWRRCFRAGDIYKKNYKIKYCVGCELEKTDSELADGRCQIHPHLTLEVIEEENYFFRFSKYQGKLLELYDKRPDFVVPDFRFNEIKAFVGRGLEDFSVSRLASKMPWGVPVPDDPAQVMYVWFDAFVNYISTLGWPDDEASFKKWWLDTGGVVQFAGKDQIRQQAAMWQAMLMSAGIATPSKKIVIHGFITSGGEKMSKSLGNVIDPAAIVKEYGADALRYYLARHIHPFEDSDFTMAKFKEAYNANLANGLGNLVSRVMKMAAANGVKFSEEAAKNFSASLEARALRKKQTDSFENFNIQPAADAVWDFVSATDRLIQEREPFKNIKVNPAEARGDISQALARLDFIRALLQPIMPDAAAKIKKAVSECAMPEKPLFPRKD